jgi:hypothetical protein
MAKSDKITKAPSGVSFYYEPQPEPQRTPCPGCGKGHVVWNGTDIRYTFICTGECGWQCPDPPVRKEERPQSLREFQPSLVPEQLRPDSAMSYPKADPAFVSETETTMTIRRRNGEILTIDKQPPLRSELTLSEDGRLVLKREKEDR